MIIVNFLIDYLILIFLPFNTYFIVNEIDKNSLFNVVLIGILLDVMYHKLFINLLLLVLIYLVVKKLSIKKKFYYIKNIVLYFVFFVIVCLVNKNFNDFIINVLLGRFLQFIYMFLYKKLLKLK